MVVETFVLGGYQGLYHKWRYLVVACSDAVVGGCEKCAEQLHVGRIDFGGIFIFRILQLADGGHVANPAFGDGQKDKGYNGDAA